MAMKNGSVVYYGHRRTRTYSNSTGALTGETYVFNQEKSRVVIANFSSTRGNRRRPNPHRYSVKSTENWNGSFTTKNSVTGRVTSVIEGLQAKTRVDNLPSPMEFSAVAYNRALSDLTEQVRSSLDLSVDLAQWRQVRDMINIKKRLIQGMANTMNSIGKSIDQLDAISRRRVRKLYDGRYVRDIRFDSSSDWYRRRARRIAEWAASKRLEYVYGWKPLAGTIVGLGEEFSDPSKEWQAWQILEAMGRDGRDFVNVVGTERRIHKIRHKCRMTIGLVPPENVMTAQLSRISSLNPVAVAWEVLPFSFVVDWFVDVGGWIRNTETAFLHGARFRYGYLTQGTYGTCNNEEIYESSTVRCNRKAFSEIKSFQRSLLGGFPSPMPPPFKVNLGADRLLNAAALLAVNARRIDGFIAKWR